MNQLSPRRDEPLCAQEPSDGLMLADAARILLTWTDLAPGRARKLGTALNTAARVLAPGLPLRSALATVPMTWPSLSRLRAAPPATFGLTPGRMTSLCSELRAVLISSVWDRTGPARSAVAVRSAARMLECVAALSPDEFAAVPALPRRRKHPTRGGGSRHVQRLSGALRGLRAQISSRESGQRRAEDLELGAPERAGLAGKPVNSVRTESFTPPPTAYPQSFQDDVARYADRLRGRDLEYIFTRDVAEPDASAAARAKRQRPLRPITIALWLGMIRGAAGALVGAGVEPERITSLRDLVDPLDHPERIIRSYLARHGGGPGKRAGDIAVSFVPNRAGPLPSARQPRRPAARLEPPGHAEATQGNDRQKPAPARRAEIAQGPRHAVSSPDGTHEACRGRTARSGCGDDKDRTRSGCPYGDVRHRDRDSPGLPAALRQPGRVAARPAPAAAGPAQGKRSPISSFRATK